MMASTATSRLALPFALVLAAALAASCGSALPDGSQDDSRPVLTVEQALAAPEGETMRVQGNILASGDDMRLCSGLAESYPPQCAEPALRLSGLDTGMVVGLSRPNQPGFADVIWSDFLITLEGVRSAGGLAVTKVLQNVAVRETAGIRVRLAYAPDPLRSPGNVAWLLDVTNALSTPLTLRFNDGQLGEVVLRRNGAEAYRWSEGKVFTQALQEIALAPGETRAISLNDELSLEPDIYDVTAWVTAESPALPQVETEIEILGSTQP
ncbi:MAG: BsuPI-related putative proteinase inhibitor [Thermoleophilia bacterium]|nr:BsuPI-related putative proteinase inhibitor [Thermoleophilia bacterium]